MSRVSGDDVRAFAAAHGLEVKRSGDMHRRSMWWIRRPGGEWRTAGLENKVAILQLTELAENTPGAQAGAPAPSGHE